MRTRLKPIIISLLICCTVSTHAHAGSLVKKAPIVAAGVWYMKSVIHISRDLSFNPHKVAGYFKKHPDKFQPVSEYVLGAIERPKNQQDYERYVKLAKVMGLTIPPLLITAGTEPELLGMPLEDDDDDGLLEHPVTPINADANIIYTPDGQPFDTSTEFPNQQIDSWEHYLTLKEQSQILADNMRDAGMGERPPNYAAHHIIAWNKNCFEVCGNLRKLLSNNNIDINSPANGVYLPNRKAIKNSSKEAYHPEIHTEKYYDYLWSALKGLDGKPDEIVSSLEIIKNLLQQNKIIYK